MIRPLSDAIELLEAAQHHYHRSANEAFFQERFYACTEYREHERSIKNCLAILYQMPTNPEPAVGLSA